MTTTSCSIQLEAVVEDSDLTHRYFLNLVTGEVVFFSDSLGLSDEDERLLEEIDAQWLQAWYQWRDKQLKAAVNEWVKSVL